MELKTSPTQAVHNKTADIEIESIIKLILVGIGIIIAIMIITSIFNNDVSEGMSNFFNILP